MKKSYKNNPMSALKGRSIISRVLLIITLQWSIGSPAAPIFEAFVENHGIDLTSFESILTGKKYAGDLGILTATETLEMEKEMERSKHEKDTTIIEKSNAAVEKVKPSTRKRKTTNKKEKLAKEFSFMADISKGSIGWDTTFGVDNPADNVFHINVDQYNSWKDSHDVFLQYDLYGIENQTGVSRSINKRPSLGGQIVKTNNSWSTKTEKLDVSWIKKGRNEVLFNSSSPSLIKYEVRNVQFILKEKQKSPHLTNIVMTLSSSEYLKDDLVYVKGFLESYVGVDATFLCNRTVLKVIDNEFEGLIKLSEEDKKRGYLVISANNETGLLGQEILYLNQALIEADYVVDTHKQDALPMKRLNKSDSEEFQVSSLRSVDYPPLNSGIVNVMPYNKGIRVSNRLKQNKRYQLNVPFDSLKIPKGYSAKDITTFHFNSDTKVWNKIDSDSLDIENQVIINSINSSGDYVNGVIQTPESPETSSFTPTSISDLQAADPASAMTIIQPPSISQKGDAGLSYPIKIPAGRNGMQPQVGIQYNSSSKSGWLGVGWDISTPAITLDTRWGTPEFDGKFETELYLLSGQQLMYPDDYLPHRHDLDAQGNYATTLQGRNLSDPLKLFTPRKQGGFAKIERIGIDPESYHWKVTASDGTVHFYGGDGTSIVENAVVRNDNNNIVHWALVMTEDVFTNNIKYSYTNTNLPATGFGNISDGTIFYLDEIIYTGHNGGDGNYKVSFENDTAVKEDAYINGKLGLKWVDPYLLKEIEITYLVDNTRIRGYEFEHVLGQFNKRLLSSVTEFDQNFNEFYKHDFEYYDDIGSGALFSAAETISIDEPNANFSLGFGDAINKSAINSNENVETGFHAGVSAGLDVFPFINTQFKQNIITISAPLGENSFKSKGKIALLDMNGDGLDDVVYRAEEGLRYIPNSVEVDPSATGNLVNNFEELEKTINNVNDFSKSKGFSKTMFGESYELNTISFQASTKRIKTKSKTTTFVTDGNGDGLMDVVHNDVVYFNTIDENTGEPTFETDSSLSENMVITANGVPGWTDPDEEPPVPVEDQAVLDFDAVQVWIAPRNGIIEIKAGGFTVNGTATYTIETSKSDIGSGTPFRMYSGTLNTSPTAVSLTQYASNAPLGTIAQGLVIPANSTNIIRVEKGQKFYFRLHNESNNGNPSTASTPFVEYVDQLTSPSDELGQDLEVFSYSKRFSPAGDGTYGIPGNGNVSISWTPFTLFPKDDFRYRIYEIKFEQGAEPDETIIFEQNVLQGQSAFISPNSNEILYNITNPNSYSGDEYIAFRFEAYSDSNSSGDFLDWRPVLTYVSSEADIEDKTIFPIQNYSTYRATNYDEEYNYILSSSNFNTAPLGAQDFYVQPFINITNPNVFDPDEEGELKLIAKDVGGNTLGKVTIELQNQQFTITSTNTFIQIANNLNLGFLGDQRFTIGLYAYGDFNNEILKKYVAAIGQDEAMKVYYGNGNANASHEAVAIEYFSNFRHLGSLRGNWGQFFYNEQYDPSSNLMDAIGKLINDDIVENPVLNYDFAPNVPAGICDPNSEDYAQCIEDQMGLPDPNTDINDGNIDSVVDDIFDDQTGTMNGIGYTIPEINFIPARATRDNLAQVYGYWAGLTSNQYFKRESFRTENMATAAGGGGGDGGTPGETGPFAGVIVESDMDGNYASINPETGMHAIEKVHKSSTRTKAAGFGPVTFSKSETGYSYTAQDYFDLNGDQYPDMVYSNRLIKTNMTGGHRAALNYSSSQEKIPNVFESFNKSIALSSSTRDIRMAHAAASAGSGEELMNAFTSEGGAAYASIGLNANVDGENKENELYVDINGDGLMDRVRNSSSYQYALNKGYNNYAQNPDFEDYTGVTGSRSRPTVFNASFGAGAAGSFLNVGQQANSFFSFNLGYSSSQTTSERSYKDINGDGLTDIIETEPSGLGNQSKVRFNTGTSFLPAENLQAEVDLGRDNRSRSVAASGEIGFYFGFPICCYFFPLIHLKFGVIAGGNVNLTVSDTKQTFKDLNGDGYADFIEEDAGSGNTNLKVYYSKIGRTNMLKKVDNPLGGSFTVDFEPQAKTYGNPNSKWALTEVLVEDGVDLADDGEDTYRMEYEYFDGKYNRRERSFYGYGKVQVKEFNPGPFEPSEESPYRTSVSTYFNSSYFLEGLLKTATVIKGEPGNVIGLNSDSFSKTINYYTVYGLQEDNTEIDIANVLPEDYDVGGTEGRGTAAVLLTKTETELYELSNGILTARSEMEYDQLGRVILYKNFGDINDPSHDYTSTITYHDDTLLLDNNILNIPKEIEVKIGGTTKRKRETDLIDPATGTIGEIIAHIDASTTSLTSFRYDSYGNLGKITYPENDASQAMFYEYTYDTTNNKYVESTSNAYGYTSTASYNPKLDVLLETVDIAGNKMTYEYDLFGRTTKIVAPKEETGPGDPFTIKYDYYLEVGQLPVSTVTVAEFLPVAVTKHYDQDHPTDPIETYTFIDGLGRPVQVKKDITFASLGTITPGGGSNNKMSISGKIAYDGLGRAVKAHHPWYENKDQDINFKVNDYTSNYFATTEYDELNRLTKTTDADGNDAFMEFELDGNLHITRSIVNQSSLNQVITEIYKDAMGRMVKTNNVGPSGDLETNFDYNAISELQSYTDAENITTSYTYDLLGRKSSIIHPDNGTTLYTYDNASNMISLTTANLTQSGGSIDYVYDFNRLTNITFPQVGGSSNIADVTYQYGAAGNETGRIIYQQDATGTQEFLYGNMGELTSIERTVVGPDIPTRTYETMYSYDSWNRVQSITYPDTEVVTYDYDKGGNLNKITGNVAGNPYEYIKDIKYDYFEQKTYMELGNGTKTNYAYTPELRRMKTLNLRDGSNNYLLRNTYTYDYIGNVLSIGNVAGFNNAQNMGGAYSHTFDYDVLNRLSDANGSFSGNGFAHGEYSSSYSLSMEYNETHGILEKSQNHQKNNTTYSANTYLHDYSYIQGTHQLEKITKPAFFFQIDFTYDLNGNMTEKSDSNSNQTDYYWDESNRLRVVDDQIMMQHYIYDASGERILKSGSNPTGVYENGTPITTGSIQFNNHVTYPSGLLVMLGNGVYTKHYFSGSSRVVSRIGDKSATYFDEVPGEPLWETIKQKQIGSLQQVAFQADKGVVTFKKYQPATEEEEKKQENEMLTAEEGEEGNAKAAKAAPPLYFYHPDHLGTGTYITDGLGDPYQFFLNLPFGETMLEQENSTGTYSNRWKFNGKELDQETGLYYYGARFYDPSLSIWLSVDPLAEQFPNMSPYNYTLQNPINMVDPTGMAPEWVPDKNGNLIAEKGDNAQTLAKYLNTTETKAQAMIDNQQLRAENYFETNPDVAQGQKLKLDNNMTRSIKNSYGRTYDQEKAGKTGVPLDPNDAYNCHGSCVSAVKGEEINRESGAPSSLKSPISHNDSDNLNQYKRSFTQNVDPSEAVFGQTVVTYGNAHSAVFYGRSQDGTIYLYSKNGNRVAPGIFKMSTISKQYETTTNIFGSKAKLDIKFNNYNPDN